MRSLIILEVEHDETTDEPAALAEWVKRQTIESWAWDNITVTDYSFCIDVPPYVYANNVPSFIPR